VLTKAAESLSKWLGKTSKRNSDWRMAAQNAAGLQTRDGRHSRMLGEFIRAANTPPRSPERQDLLCSLLDNGGSSRSTKQANGFEKLQNLRQHLRREAENEKLQRDLDAFLVDILTAQNTRPGKEHE
jgi:hypothetical protein